MPITLVIQSGAESYPDLARSKTFESGRWTIGRKEHNDWCLPHPTVSRRHCVIIVENGRATLTDTSTHGVFTDGSTSRVPKGETISLRTGQRLTIGAFDIEVRLGSEPLVSAGQADRTQIDGVDWASAESRLPSRRSAYGQSLKGRHAPEREPDAFEAWEKAGEPKAPRPNVERDQAIHASWAPPTTSPPASESPPPESEPPMPSNAPKELPPNLADLLAAKAEDRNAEPAIAPPSRPMRGIEPGDRREAEDADWSVAGVTSEAGQTTSSQIGAMRTVPTPGGPERPALAAFFEGARLDHRLVASCDPETILHQAGAMVRTVVDGVMRLLQARGQMKGEFGIDRTVFAPGLNNPLKFSGDVDHALELLLAGSSKHYQAPDEAMSEAIGDVIQHQLQMLESFQRAWQDLLHHLDPEALEQRVEKDRGIASLFGAQKARCWDIYKERYREVLAESERIFRQEMAASYESRDDESR